MVKYVQCVVCGRMTPTDRGTCYHCGSPLPSDIKLPLGLVICPNCLRPTPVNTGFCLHCRAPLPPDLVDLARREIAKYRVFHRQDPPHKTEAEAEVEYDTSTPRSNLSFSPFSVSTEIRRRFYRVRRLHV